MEIILKEDILNLGYKDDIITVKNGYGRNFLIPQHKAILATVQAKKVLAENKKQRSHKEASIKLVATTFADKLKVLDIKIGAKTSSTGKIFGSVNTIQLAEAIALKGLELDRKKISIKNEESIKTIGNYIAVIKLHKEVIVDLPFEVISE